MNFLYMNNTINRRKFIKLVSRSLATIGVGALIAPVNGLYPSSRAVQVVNRSIFAYSTSPDALQPHLTTAEIDFLAAHELKTGDLTRKVVLMTYDDIFRNDKLSHLLDVYREHGIKCTFFIIGVNLEDCKATLPRVVDEGHELGCHGWVHNPFTSLSDESIRGQFKAFVTKVDEIIPGYKVKYFRAPYGDRDMRVRTLAASWGMQHVLWSLESGGMDKKTEHNVVDRAQNGSIVLSHASRQFDVSEADVIVKELIRKGFNLVTISSGMDPADRYVG
jgi:peptidoglycan/xylan/chitin deacetylase (PgdA/CDA1 family)